jgi:hypothetical protein
LQDLINRDAFQPRKISFFFTFKLVQEINGISIVLMKSFIDRSGRLGRFQSIHHFLPVQGEFCSYLPHGWFPAQPRRQDFPDLLNFISKFLNRAADLHRVIIP